MTVRRTLAALAIGVVLALAACGGDGEAGDAPDSEEESPQPVPADAGETIGFLADKSKMTTSGCTANLTFAWRADDPASVPSHAEAVIEVTGPKIAGTYERRAESGTVTLTLSATVDRDTAEWTGTLVSVAGKEVRPETPITHPFLASECGGGKPTPASELPPGTPVPGAPCDPDQPAPAPNLECEKVP